MHTGTHLDFGYKGSGHPFFSFWSLAILAIFWRIRFWHFFQLLVLAIFGAGAIFQLLVLAIFGDFLED